MSEPANFAPEWPVITLPSTIISLEVLANNVLIARCEDGSVWQLIGDKMVRVGEDQ